MKKVNRQLIAAWTSVTGDTVTPAIPVDSRLREIWLEFTGDAAAGVTPDFTAMGQILIKQTGPANNGQLCQADTLAPLALQMNRRGGIVDATYTAGGACYGSICVYYAYEEGDERNCLHFQDGQGIAIQFGATGGGAAVWDSITVEVYAVYADDEECMQLYVPITSQRQPTLGGTNPIEMEDNLLEFSSTAASVTNPTSLQLLTGNAIEVEGSWEGLKRMANSVYPIEATQTTVQSVLHGRFENPADIFQMVRHGTTLRYVGGSGTTQLFQRYAKFNAVGTAASIRSAKAIAEAKRAKLREGTEIPEEIKAIALPVIAPVRPTRAAEVSRSILPGFTAPTPRTRPSALVVR